nr:hypothetical protein HUO10_003282 [Paraburkholderia busanensis]
MSQPFSFWKLAPKNRKLCAACDGVASTKLEVRNSVFRGDDDVYLVCDEHRRLWTEGHVDAFYYDFAMTKHRRQQS